MGKRLLASFLAVAMMLTMAPFAFAIENTEDTIDADQIPATEEAVAGENQIETKNTSTLQSAIDAAETGATVAMSADTTADITISKNLTLDLGDYTLTNTNAGKATITVANGAAVTVKNGSVVGGKSFYNIQVAAGGTLTLEGVTATAGNSGSSMIDNWGTLTISSGDYSGGLNVVKSEEDSKLTIDGGKFTLSYATNGYTGVILAYGTTTITGGEFIQSLTTTGRWNHPQVVATGVVEGHPAITKITGGTFTNNMSGEGIFRGIGKGTSDNFEVSGGTFNKGISDGYCADGFIPTKNADGTYGVKEGKYVAAIGSKKYETLADAIRLAAKGKTVKLLNDVDLDKTIAVSGKTITLDMNGHMIYNTNDLWDKPTEADQNWSLISVRENSNLTITGNGTLKAKKNDCYAIDVQDKNAVLTVENGKVVGNIHAVYVTKGTAYIKGGTYSIQQKYPTEEKADEFVLNLYDASGRDGTAKIVVTGGTFEKFNPANCQAEGAGTNFLATGYITTKVGDNYVVKANANKNISDLDTAINTIKDATSSQKDKNAAVDVIKNIDNADLANNSAAMGKLAALDNTLTDTTSGLAKVTVTGESTVESIASNQVAVTNAALSADLTSNQAQNVKVTIADGSATIDADDVNAAKKAAGITDDVAVQKLNISMTVNGKTVEKPTAPVVLEFPLPTEWKGCQIVCVDDANNPEVIPTTVIGNTVKATFNHFSDYAMLSSTKVANPNKYQLVLTPTNNQTTVYPGDEITFDVVLKRTEGNSNTVNTVQFTPTSDMLTVTSTTVEDGFTYNTTLKKFTHLNAGEPVSLTDGKVKIGTMTCTVNGNTAGRQNLVVTPNDQDTVTISGYDKSNGLTVAEIPVEYDFIKVYFTNYTGKLVKGNEETEMKTFYTSANNKNLYASLDALAARTPVADAPTASDGSIVNDTQYRLVDENNNLNNWVAADGTTKYVDVVADSGTGFTDNMSFYVSRVKLLKVDKPDDVNVDSKVTTRGSTTYVDYNEDFTFTVPDAGNGKKNEVKVTVNDKPVTATPDSNTNNKYTVNKSYMNDSPVKITVTPVIDLDVDNIRVFDDGDGAFLQYSKYSGTDTLVLIKGNPNVKYILNPGEGVEAPEIYTLPMGHGYGDYTLAVLIPRPELSTGADARAIMLDYLKNTYHIAVTEGTNTVINAYDFDTNGDGNGTGTFRLDDAQATYDFSALEKAAMYWEPSDVELLKADVLTYANANKEYNTPRDGQVTTEDVDAFLYNYVYTPSARPSDTTP